MAKALIIRNVPKAQQHSLKRQARGKRQSVNSFMLQIIADITIMDIENFKANQKSKKLML